MAMIYFPDANSNDKRLNPAIQPTPSRSERALPIHKVEGGSSETQAGDSVQISPAAAIDTDQLLRDHADPPVNGDLLASVRRDLIASAGRSLGITAPTDAQRALELLGGAKSTGNSSRSAARAVEYNSESDS